MIYDNGVVYVCSLVNTAPNGRKPKNELVKRYKFWFNQRTIGYNRQYLAKGVNEQVDMLIRIPYCLGVRIGMFALLGNGEQYHINNVSHGLDDINALIYTEITLERLDDNYDVAD